MKNKRKEKLLSSTSPKGLNSLGGVSLVEVNEKKSAIASYFEQEGKEIDFTKPFDEKAIDFMLDSFVLEGAKDDLLLKKMKEGFSVLNQKSITARQMMFLIGENLPIRISENNKDDTFFVRYFEERVFIAKHLIEKMSPERLVIEFLHEIGHLDEYKGLHPMGVLNKRFIDNRGNLLNSELLFNLSEKNGYQMNLISEAEKQAISYQIDVERRSFLNKMLLCVTSFCLGCSEIFKPDLLERKESEVMRGTLAFSYMANLVSKQIKNALKKPHQLFFKKGRDALAEKSKNEAISDFILYLTLPKKEKKGLLAHYKLLSLGIACVPLMMSFAGVMGMSLEISSGLLYGLSVGSCLGVAGLGYIFENKRAFQERWADSYHEQAILNLLVNLNSSCKQKNFDALLMGMSQKYGKELSVEDLKKTEVDEYALHNFILAKKVYKSLSDQVREEFNQFIEIISKKEKKSSCDQKCHASSIQMIAYLMEENKVSDEISEERLFQMVHRFIDEQSEDLASLLQNVTQKDINKIKNKSLKNKLLKLKAPVRMTQSKERTSKPFNAKRTQKGRE